MAFNREEKALRGFKQIIRDLIYMLQQASGAETVYLNWVNRSREQFVLEARFTTLPNVVFADRVDFSSHFLNRWKDREKPVQLGVGSDIDEAQLTHYNSSVPVRQLTILPFVNNGETVALTVLESSKPLRAEPLELVYASYLSALSNVLNTYLELTDHFEQQQEWVDYEESLSRLSPRLHKVEILDRMLREMKRLLPHGGVSLVSRGMDTWTHILYAEGSLDPASIGLRVDESSITYNALQKGEPLFAIHFNQSPKRLAAGEPDPDGSTLAIPLIIDDRRYAVVVAYDANPLIFKESTKHQLINLVRTAALMIRINLGKMSVESDLLTSDYGSFIPDVWEKSLESAIRRAGESVDGQTWFGLITIENLPALRSHYRLDDLNRLQRMLTKVMNPSNHGFSGYIGFHSDYVFSFLLQDKSESAADRYLEKINETLSRPVVISSGQEVPVRISSGLTMVSASDRDAHQVLSRTKEQLSRVVRST